MIFKRQLFDALRRADPAAGAKAVVRAVQVEDVETGDPGVVEDVDTPEEYARLFGLRAVADGGLLSLRGLRYEGGLAAVVALVSWPRRPPPGRPGPRSRRGAPFFAHRPRLR